MPVMTTTARRPLHRGIRGRQSIVWIAGRASPACVPIPRACPAPNPPVQRMSYIAGSWTFSVLPMSRHNSDISFFVLRSSLTFVVRHRGHVIYDFFKVSPDYYGAVEAGA